MSDLFVGKVVLISLAARLKAIQAVRDRMVAKKRAQNGCALSYYESLDATRVVVFSATDCEAFSEGLCTIVKTITPKYAVPTGRRHHVQFDLLFPHEDHSQFGTTQTVTIELG